MFESTWDDLVGLPSRLSADEAGQQVCGEGEAAHTGGSRTLHMLASAGLQQAAHALSKVHAPLLMPALCRAECVQDRNAVLKKAAEQGSVKEEGVWRVSRKVTGLASAC
jgi:hypothetical protein